MALLNDKDLGVSVCEAPRLEVFFVPCYLGDALCVFCSCEEFLTRVLGCGKSCFNGLGLWGGEPSILGSTFFS